MEFIVESKIWTEYPNLNIGVVIAKNIRNDGRGINLKTRDEESRIRSSFQIETLAQDPNIAVWREAYKRFGAKSEYKSSIENLYRLVLKGIELRSINPLVDIYNYISLKYMLPVGGEDLDQIVGNLVLGYATDNEKPGLLLGESEPRAVPASEILYKDDEGVVCRRWNWKEADRTKLTADTQNAILIIESLTGREVVESATQEITNLISKHCGGKLEKVILDNILQNTTIY